MLKHDLHLTVLNSELDTQIKTTAPGMASWSIPTATTTCADCIFLLRGKNPKVGHCAKYSAMMFGRQGPAVPIKTKSCRYFRQRADLSATETGEEKVDMRRYSGSVFYGVDDVKNGPIQGKIAGVKIGKFEKPDLLLENGDKVSVNGTNNKTLGRAYGWNSDDWIGHTIEMYLGSIEYQGREQPALLIRPISKPEKPPTPLTKKSAIDEFSDSDLPF
jgi:hypothetical protein